jgi:hypothetical protein
LPKTTAFSAASSSSVTIGLDAGNDRSMAAAYPTSSAHCGIWDGLPTSTAANVGFGGPDTGDAAGRTYGMDPARLPHPGQMVRGHRRAPRPNAAELVDLGNCL